MKPGYKTSEFWVTLPTLALSLAAMFFLIPEQDFEMLQEILSQVIAGVIALISLISYVTGRVMLKKEEIKSQGIVG